MLVTVNIYHFKYVINHFQQFQAWQINMCCMDWNHSNYKTNSLFIQAEFFHVFPLNKKWKKSI